MSDYYKICIICKSDLEAEKNFHKDKQRKDGYNPRCKQCMKKHRRNHYLKNKERTINQALEWRSKNIGLVNEKAKIWKQNNPDKVNNAIKKYKKKYPDRVIMSQKKWINNNREKRREITRRSCHKLRSTIKGYLNHKFSSLLYKSLKRNKKCLKWEFIVGYTVDDLKKHLENLFKNGMSWENRNQWHIDHKIPVSKFNFKSYEDEDFRQCWALNNLQPLWAIENLKKGNRF